MSLKEELKKLRTKIFVGQETVSNSSFTEEEKKLIERVTTSDEGYIAPADKALAEYLSRNRNIYLNEKVEAFIKWYYHNVVKDNYPASGKRQIQEMRDLIEKMAVWYELRYPSYEVNKMMYCCGQNGRSIDEVMFNHNPYINSFLDENADTRYLEWSKFYNYQSFVQALPWKERHLFESPRYSDIVYVDLERSVAHLHLLSDGTVEMAEGLGIYTNYSVIDQELEGVHIKDVLARLKEKGISLPSNNELESVVRNVEQRLYQRNEFFYCVMYRIIERGGNRIGPRRGFLFAQEFGLNIDIPMKYAVDYSDPGLRLFINNYLMAGGDATLLCYVDYFGTVNNNEQLKTVSITDLLQTITHSATSKYTPEEEILHQKLVDLLRSQVNPNELKQEQVKQLRLSRKLAKSKRQK